jgi:Beta protein
MSQQALPIPSVDPPAVGRAPYVPLLLDRPGERVALQRADDETWASMRPLIAVTRWGDPPTHGSLKGRALALRDAVGTRHFYLDLADIAPNRMISDRGSRRPTLEVLHDEAARRGLAFIPVARPTDGPRRLAIVAQAVLEHGRGLAVRHKLGSGLRRTGEGPADRLLRTVEAVGAHSQNVDLILDLAWLDPDAVPSSRWIARQVQALSARTAWRSIVLAGTCVPQSASAIAEAGELGWTRRTEWSLWQDVDAATDVNVVFGDYGVQHPRVPSKDGRAFGNVRYTTAADLYVSRGRLLSNMDAGDIAAMCRRITAGPFSGPDFSWGDGQIHTLAARRASTRSAIFDEPDDDPDAETAGMRGPAFWRAVGTSHHLKFVTTQLAPDRSPAP